MENILINNKRKTLTLNQGETKCVLTMRLVFFESGVPDNIENLLDNYYEDILKMEIKLNKRTIIIIRNPANTIVVCKNEGQTLEEISTNKDFDFSGFNNVAKYLSEVSAEVLPSAMKQTFELYGFDKKMDSFITLNGEEVNLRCPDNYLMQDAESIELIKRCRLLSENYNFTAKPGIIDAIETNAIKDIILNNDVQYKFHIIGGDMDLFSVVYDDYTIISIPIAHIASYGINILTVLNEHYDSIEFYCGMNQIDKECGIAHLYFPEKFTGKEPLSARHYAAFGDTDGLMKYIDKQLNSISSYDMKIAFLSKVNEDLHSVGLNLTKELEGIKSAISQVSKAQQSRQKSLDDMLAVRQNDDLDVEYGYTRRRPY